MVISKYRARIAALEEEIQRVEADGGGTSAHADTLDTGQLSAFTLWQTKTCPANAMQFVRAHMYLGCGVDIASPMAVLPLKLSTTPKTVTNELGLTLRCRRRRS